MNKYDNIIKAEVLASWKETLQGWHNAEKQVLSTMQRVRIWVEEHGLSKLFIEPKNKLKEHEQRQLEALLATAASVYGWNMSTPQGKNAAQQFKSRIKKLLLEGEMAIAYRSKEQRKKTKKRNEPKAKQMAKLIAQALAKLSKSRAKGVREARELLNKAIELSK